MKFKSFFQRRSAGGSHAESETGSSSPSSSTLKRKKKDTKILTTTMKATTKPIGIGTSCQDKCASSPGPSSRVGDCGSGSSSGRVSSSNNGVQPQPDESSLNFMRYTGTACEQCGGSGRTSQSDSGIADDTTMKLPADLDQDSNMEKAQEELEKNKALLLNAQDKIKELSCELEKVKQDNVAKDKEYGKMREDFLLCIRSADRFRNEAEKKVELLQAEVDLLRKKLARDKSETDGVTIIVSTKQNSCNEGLESNLNEADNNGGASTQPSKPLSYTPVYPRNAKNLSPSPAKNTANEGSIEIETESSPVINPPDLQTTDYCENEGTSVATGKFPKSVSKLAEAQDFKNLSSVVSHVMDTPKFPDSLDENMNTNRHEKLDGLRKNFRGSLRNALLNWCKCRTANYRNVEITNFSTSWTNGLALAALIHSLDPSLFNYSVLSTSKSMYNFKTALGAAERLGLKCQLNDLNRIVDSDNPPWEPIFAYVSELYVFSA